MKTLLFGLFLTLLISCKPNNERTFENFNVEFSDSIAKNKAVKYHYHYDPLTAQSSFFVGSKLKFLKYRHAPEMGLMESLVFFDLKTDSISKIIRRRIEHKWDDKNKVIVENATDTIFVIQENHKQTLTYVGNKQISSKFNKQEFETERKFINTLKKQTEKSYNGN